jgi:putative transposase
MADDIATIIKAISAAYVYHFNNRHDRCGHLFQERYRSEPVEDEDYFLTVLRYIIQNPLKAGMVTAIEDYPWSSFHTMFSCSDLINNQVALEMFSEYPDTAIKQLLVFLRAKNDDRCIEHDGFAKPTDEDLQAQLLRMGVSDIKSLPELDRKLRNRIIQSLQRYEGISLRQLERVTGMPKSTFYRIWQKSLSNRP